MIARMRSWAATVAAAALGCALLLLLPDLLIVRERRFYRERLPDVFSKWELNGRYTVFSLDSDITTYPARAAETARKGWPYDPHIRENRSGRLDTADTLSFLLLGGLTNLLGDVDRAWLAARALGGAAWVLLFYWLALLASSNRRFSLACAVGVTLFNDVLDMMQYDVLGWPREFALRVAWVLGPHWFPFGVSRVPRPAVSYPILFAALGLALLASKTKKAAPLAAGAALGGLLAYVHSDVFSMYAGAMALWVLQQTYVGKRFDPRWAVSGAISIVLALPWVLHNVPLDPDTLLSYWITHTRRPDLNGLWAFGLAFWCWRAAPKNEAMSLTGAALAAAGLAMETQLVTGYTMFHSFIWHNVGLVFAVLAVAGLAGRKLPDRRDWVWLAACFMLAAAGRSVSYAAQRAPHQGMRADMQAALAFLDANTEPDSVVAALGSFDTQLIPAYAHNKTLLNSGFAIVSDLPLKEELRRLLRALELFGVPEAAYWKALAEHERADPNEDLWHGRPSWADFDWRAGPFPYAAPREQLLARYRELSPLSPAREARADYLWVGPFERELLTPPQLAKLGKPLFTSGAFAIYIPVSAIPGFQ